LAIATKVLGQYIVPLFNDQAVQRSVLPGMLDYWIRDRHPAPIFKHRRKAKASSASRRKCETLLTCLWAYTTEPRSFQVPPRRSMRTIRRIWKNRIPRRVEAANTWPLEPIQSTTKEANMVLTSARGTLQWD